VLYVGAKARKRMPTGLWHLRRCSEEIVCLEIWEPNVKALRKTDFFDEVWHGDIADRATLLSVAGRFDLIFWWHGPEHVSFPQAIDTCNRLHAAVVVCACPWGKYEQGACFGNPYEVHASALLPEDFERLGYEVTVSGKRDVPKSNIFAVKRHREREDGS
jgi:hypothetical protein